MHQHGPLDADALLLLHPWLSRRQNAWDIPFDVPLTLQSIWTMFNHLLVTRYLIVASFALGFYDYFLTLPNERAYVWTSRPSVVRSIYFFVRYSYFPIGVLTLYGQSSVASAVNQPSTSRASPPTVSRVHRCSISQGDLPDLYQNTILLVPVSLSTKKSLFIPSLAYRLMDH